MRIAAAAVLALLLIDLWWHLNEPGLEPPRSRPPAIAWLVNAQDCQWAPGIEPMGDLEPGSHLLVERGLAELRFRSGARIVLEGPAELELLSDNSAALRRGRLTARVPQPATGFTLLSPHGKLIDLGTEFGVSVDDDGAADVVVFAGQVKASPSPQAGSPVELKKDQEALLGQSGVVVQPGPAQAKAFVRAITPPPVLVPRTITLDFRRPVDATIRDAAGRGTGLTHRLPGTGAALPADDPNLKLDDGEGRLQLRPTSSNLDTQLDLDQGEYLGVRLADLGFTGEEDFAVTATVLNIPTLKAWVGQFGLYAGVRSDKNIRGGVLSRWEGRLTQFLVHNNGGRDSDLYRVGLVNPGDDLRLTLSRTAGKYALMIENLTTGNSSTLTITPPYLDGERDLYVGLLSANDLGWKAAALVFKEFKVTVWTRSP